MKRSFIYEKGKFCYKKIPCILNDSICIQMLRILYIWLQRKRDAGTECIYKLENGMVEFSVAFCFPLCSGTAALAFEVFLSKEEGYLKKKKGDGEFTLSTFWNSDYTL